MGSTLGSWGSWQICIQDGLRGSFFGFWTPNMGILPSNNHQRRMNEGFWALRCWKDIYEDTYSHIDYPFPIVCPVNTVISHNFCLGLDWLSYPFYLVFAWFYSQPTGCRLQRKRSCVEILWQYGPGWGYDLDVFGSLFNAISCWDG